MPLSRSGLLAGLLAGLIAVLAAGAAQAIEYTILELDALPGFDDYGAMYPTGINASGQVVGYAFKSGIYGISYTNEYQAFVTGPNGVGVTRLGGLGTNWSKALGINDSGQVVGVAGIPSGNSSRAFLGNSSGGPLTDLGTLAGNSSAVGINEAGQVVGNYTSVAGHSRMFITDPGGGHMRDLGSLGGVHSFATGINDRGQVIGSAQINPQDSAYFSGNRRPFISDPNGGALHEIPVPGAYMEYAQQLASANAISDRGDVVGTFESYLDYSSPRPFYAPAGGVGRLLDVSPLQWMEPPNPRWVVMARALAVNSSGQVGGSYDYGFNAGAFISGPDGTGLIDVADLDIRNAEDSPGGFYSVTGINDSGQFVAHSLSGRAYLLSPVPEPATALLLLAGTGWIGGLARRRVSASSGS